MSEADKNSMNGQGENRGRRTVTIAVMALVLVVVTVVVIQTIQRAPSAGGSGGQGGPPTLPPAAVYVTDIIRENTRDEAMVTGTFRATSHADVAAREAGAVAEVLVDEGDSVKTGTILAKLDERRVSALLNEARAALESAENLVRQRDAERARASTDLEMKQALRGRDAISASDLLDAEKMMNVAIAQHRSAEDGIKAAQSRLEFLKVQQADLTVVAPFDGVVVARNVEPGEWVAAGTVIASIVAMNPIEAWLRVPARHSSRANSDLAAFRVRRSSSGEIFKPTKATAIPDVDGRSQLFTLVATIENADGSLIPGESVTGIVPVADAKPYWRIPVNAVVQSPRGTIVQVVQAPEGGEGLPTGRAVPVRVAFERNGNAYVDATNEGFKHGDQIVVEGNERLRPGQSLMIRTAGEGAEPKAP